MLFSPILERLTQAFKCLPGVGVKSAQRMVLHLLQRDRKGAVVLAEALLEAVEKIRHCSQCRVFSEIPLCRLCMNPKRNHRLLCVVENPEDVYAIEHSGSFQGLYHVLMGALSPLDGVGPEDLGLPLLKQRIWDQLDIEEMIIATNPTIEGEATAYYIYEMVKQRQPEVKVTRIAYGVSMGGEVRYTDARTLSMALLSRSNFQT